MRWLLLLGLLAPALPAQDCHVFRSAFDNPFSDTKGYWQPRIAWHLEKAGVAWVATRKAPRWVKILPAVIVTGLHVRGAVRGYYKVNAGDWIADAWMVSASLVTPKVWAMGYPVAACFASP